MIRTGSRTEFTTPLVVLAVLVVASAGALGAVAAQDSPGEPHNFHGSASNEAGDPAPAGVEIFAVIDGEVQDSIVVDETGEYGGPDAFDDKLTVDDGAGSEVVFTVGSADGPEALESPYDLGQAEGSVTELDLTFPEGAFVETAAFQVSIDEEASTLEADAGGDLTVVATVENAGDASGTQAVTATVANDTVGDETVSLESGGNATVGFTFTADAAYDGEPVAVASENDSATATLSVADGSGGGSGGAPGGPGGSDTGGDDGGDGDGGDGSDDGGDDGSDDSGDGNGSDDGDGSDDGGSDGADGADDGEPDDTGDGSDDSDDGNGSDDGTPGFGILIGAVVVLGSALLLRRE